MTTGIRSVAAACVLGMLAVSAASGALILDINTTNKTFSFTGTDTGDTQLSPFAQWDSAHQPVYDGPYDSSLFFTPEMLLSEPDDLTSSAYINMRNIAGEYAYCFVDLHWGASGVHTLTGTGVSVSYAALGAGALAMFEGQIGHALVANTSSTFHDIAVVPEPTSIVLLGLGAAVLALRRRLARR